MLVVKGQGACKEERIEKIHTHTIIDGRSSSRIWKEETQSRLKRYKRWPDTEITRVSAVSGTPVSSSLSFCFYDRLIDFLGPLGNY